MRTPFEVGKIDGALDERKRIRKAISPALRELRDSEKRNSARVNDAIDAIENATRSPRRQAKRKDGKGA